LYWYWTLYIFGYEYYSILLSYEELKEKEIQENARIVFKDRRELELFKKNIIHPFEYTSDIPSECISNEQIKFLFGEKEDNDSFSKIKLNPPSISSSLLSQKEGKELKILEDPLKFITQYTRMSSFLPPRIHKPFLFPHSPLVPCNSSCDIVHFHHHYYHKRKGRKRVRIFRKEYNWFIHSNVNN
jgi:hypothetical protein